MIDIKDATIEALRAENARLQREVDQLAEAWQAVKSEIEKLPKDVGTSECCKSVTVQEAAQVLINEVLKKPCEIAAKQREKMIRATMKTKIRTATAWQRWQMVNDALRAIAEMGSD